MDADWQIGYKRQMEIYQWLFRKNDFKVSNTDYFSTGVYQNDLTNDQRHVVILRYLEGFSLRETAAIIGKEENHVKVIQDRAIAKIRQVLNYNEIRTIGLCPRIGNLSKASTIR